MGPAGAVAGAGRLTGMLTDCSADGERTAFDPDCFIHVLCLLTYS